MDKLSLIAENKRNRLKMDKMLKNAKNIKILLELEKMIYNRQEHVMPLQTQAFYITLKSAIKNRIKDLYFENQGR